MFECKLDYNEKAERVIVRTMEGDCYAIVLGCSRDQWGKLLSFESLVPESFGRIYPEHLVSLAEQLGLIVLLKFIPGKSTVVITNAILQSSNSVNSSVKQLVEDSTRPNKWNYLAK